MWFSWMHLISVHVPIILVPVCFILLLRAQKTKLIQDYNFSYYWLLFTGLLTTVAYFTGPEAATYTETVQTLQQELIETHALWGRISFTVLLITTGLGMVGLLAHLQDEDQQKWLPPVTLVSLIISFALLLYTGHLGGLLRRPDMTTLF